MSVPVRTTRNVFFRMTALPGVVFLPWTILLGGLFFHGILHDPARPFPVMVTVLFFLLLVAGGAGSALWALMLARRVATQMDALVENLAGFDDGPGLRRATGSHADWFPEIRAIADLAGDLARREDQAVRREQAQESRYRSLFLASGEAIILHDPDGNISEMNDRARILLARMNLWTLEEAGRARRLHDLFPPRMADGVGRHLDSLRNSAYAHWESTVASPSGVNFLDISSYVADREAGLCQTLMRDITAIVLNRQKIENLNRELSRMVDSHAMELHRSREELEATRKELVQKEKIGLLLTVLASLGHEMETPLGVGVSLASMFMERSRETRKSLESGDLTKGTFTDFLVNTEEAGKVLLDSMERAGDLMRSLKDLAVDQASRVERVFSLNEYLSKIRVSVLPRLRKSPHHLEVDCREPLFLRGNPGSLYQIIMNLVNNSLLHAFPGGREGLMSVSAAVMDHMVVIRYRDNGCGIPAEIRDRIWEPYFTTRRTSGGSGLGLHIVKGLVEDDFKGTIHLEATPEWSTSFVMVLPRVSPEEAGTTVPQEGPSGI